MKDRFFCFSILLVFCCLECSGCAPVENILSYMKSRATDEPYVSYEERVYNEAVDEFFAALDARNEEEIYNLFSPYVRENDEDLKEQIERLLKVYPGPTDICKRDGGMLAGSYANDHGTGSSEVGSSFQVVSNGNNYWCWFQLMYENDFDKKKIGISEVEFYTADYYCAIRYDEEGADYAKGPGLSVLSEYPISGEIRAIAGYPYKYTQTERVLNQQQVLDFFGHSNRYSDFIEQFGKPNAENIHHIYELLLENGEQRYLSLGVDEQEDTIFSAYIVDEFDYISTLWTRKQQEIKKNEGKKAE